MKAKFSKYFLLFLLLAVVAESVSAQRNRRRTTRRTNNTRQAANPTPPPPAPDTIAPIIVGAKEEKILPSMRNDAAIERNLIKSRIPLTYEHIREDDAVYRQRVWREIDVHEKINLPFMYPAKEDNGDQHLISILLKAIKEDTITAFDPIDDRFTTPITGMAMKEMLGGKADTVEVPDVTDPTGTRMIKKITYKQFNPDDVVKYRLKEEWVFDKESSRMHVRILGIAPLQMLRNSNGDIIGEAPMFWLYYPDLRPSLAKAEVYNAKNYGARMSWEELFEGRMFSSYIVKSTIDNPFDRKIREYVTDPILALLEGDNVRDKIFNYEQDLWSY
jgi:gliding motility associated protien GldN